jgi:predicted metal-dependent hydrolase
MRQIIRDKEFGDIEVRVNTRTSKLIAHAKDGAIWLTTPPYVTKSDIIDMIDEHREKLRKILEGARRRIIDTNYKIDSELFKLSLRYGAEGNMMAHSKLGELEIVCPKETNFSDISVQQALRKAIEESMRINAKVVIPERLNIISKEHKLPFKTVKISSSRGRWGSCSTDKNINISFYTLLLPTHLVDYVLKHELCHTREMNHSNSFWSLLNDITGGKAFELRDELRSYQPSI